MSEEKMDVGSIGWRDLTVPDAERVRDFYQSVVRWGTRPEDMGGYSDYHILMPATGESVAGICHARGSNADLPAQWLIYVVVEEVNRSAARALGTGGQVVVAPRPLAGGRFRVIRDPAGAVCALYQPQR